MPIILDPIIPPPTSDLTAGWSVIVPPTYAPVDAQALQDHLRANDYQLDLTVAAGLIAAATDYAEDAMSLCLAARTIAATFDADQPLALPRGPLIRVDGVSDARGVATTAYRLSHVGHQTTIVPTTGMHGAVTVIYRAGFAGPPPIFLETAAAIPAGIRQSIKMHAGTLFECRESTTDKPRVAVPHALDDFYRRKCRAIGVA